MDCNHDEETEEEHAVRLRKISEEVKADIKAGRYKYGQIHPNIRGTITGRFDYDSEIYPPVSERKEFRQAVHNLIHKYPDSVPFVIFDECHHIKPQDYWLGYDTPKEKDWDRKSFKSGGPTPPTNAVRAKLRAKRKAKKK